MSSDAPRTVLGDSASNSAERPAHHGQSPGPSERGRRRAVTPHEARHCAASYFAQAGLSLKEAQEALGHADARTTVAIYQHALPGWQERAAAKLDAYLSSVPTLGVG
ncbi:MAG TPA: tyrosine-type recombinase/integrase [Actinocrinis sp.]|nr:tyrosine-type recombinase/integrase [Actinocrinis sp.]